MGYTRKFISFPLKFFNCLLTTLMFIYYRCDRKTLDLFKIKGICCKRFVLTVICNLAVLLHTKYSNKILYLLTICISKFKEPNKRVMLHLNSTFPWIFWKLYRFCYNGFRHAKVWLMTSIASACSVGIRCGGPELDFR